MPSPTEIRIKVEAAEPTVARAEKRLAAETEAHQGKLMWWCSVCGGQGAAEGAPVGER